MQAEDINTLVGRLCATGDRMRPVPGFLLIGGSHWGTHAWRFSTAVPQQANPAITQRELAQKLRVSSGEVNQCLKALINKRWVKVNNFRASSNKAAYACLLTPNGIEEKARITVRFLMQRMQDFEQVTRKIAELVAKVTRAKSGQTSGEAS